YTATVGSNSTTLAGQGTLTLNADGTFTFTPAPNFHGDLPAVIYIVADGQGGVAKATLSISVTPINDIPVAVEDAAEIAEDSAATTIDVLTNDKDSDGGTLTVTGFTVVGDETGYTTDVGSNTATLAGQGTLTLNADGTFTFTPATHFHGTVSPINYTLSDGQEGSATATLSITVTPVNDAPTASDDIASTPEDTPVFLTASDFGNFQDVDTAALTAVRIVSLPVEGVLQYQDYRGDWLSVTENQEIAAATLKQEALRFIPDAHEWATGYATLQFQVSDGQAWSDVHNLTLHVDSVNDLPENTVPEAQLLASGQTLMLDDVEVADADGEEAIEKVEISAENGTLNATEPVAGVNVSGSGSDTLVLRGTRSSLNLMFATVAYVPDPGFSGTDTLTVATTDTAGAQDTDTVSLTVSAEPPRSLFSSAPPPTTLAAPAPPEASAQAPLPPPTSQPIVVDTTPRGHIPQVFDSTLFPQRAAALVQPTYLIEPSPSQPHPLQRTLALWAFNEAYTEAPDDGWRVVVHPDTGSLLSVFRGMPDQFIEGDGMAYVSVPWDSFFHTHSNVRVTVNASLADGTPLPNWIQLNPDTGVFQLVPPRGFQGELAIRLQARDSQGREATTLFRLHVGERAQTSPRENGVPGRSALSDQLRDASRQRQSVFTPLPPQPVTPPALHPA
ncbi:MAG: hypothetical protein RI884_1598, partial [Pseudomonadota bacterium]